MESLYKERKQKQLGMSEIHGIVLGAPGTWNVPKSMFTFLGSDDENFSVPNSPKSEIWNDEYINEPKNWPCKSKDRLNTEISEKDGILVPSDNYPNQYEGGQNCKFIIKAPTGSLVRLQFWSLDIQVCKKNFC